MNSELFPFKNPDGSCQLSKTYDETLELPHKKFEFRCGGTKSCESCPLPALLNERAILIKTLDASDSLLLKSKKDYIEFLKRFNALFEDKLPISRNSKKILQ